MAVCTQCRTDNIDGVDYCENCGADLRAVDLPQPQTVVEQSIMDEPIGLHCRTAPVTVTPDTPLRKVVKVLAESGLSCVIVVDEQSRVVGIFSERDLLMRAGVDFESALDKPVADYMTPDPVVLPTDAAITYALQRMIIGDFRHLPVVDEKGLVGVISGRDMLRHLIERVKTTPPAAPA